MEGSGTGDGASSQVGSCAVPTSEQAVTGFRTVRIENSLSRAPSAFFHHRVPNETRKRTLTW